MGGNANDVKLLVLREVLVPFGIKSTPGKAILLSSIPHTDYLVVSCCWSFLFWFFYKYGKAKKDEHNLIHS